MSTVQWATNRRLVLLAVRRLWTAPPMASGQASVVAAHNRA
jgi:hypothetical protein